MLDSQEVCRQWRDGIERNQNTRRFGRAAEDGIWKDKDGNPGKVEGLFKGVGRMLKKMKDKCGF
jgi:hypothetical protein